MMHSVYRVSETEDKEMKVQVFKSPGAKTRNFPESVDEVKGNTLNWMRDSFEHGCDKNKIALTVIYIPLKSDLGTQKTTKKC